MRKLWKCGGNELRVTDRPSKSFLDRLEHCRGRPPNEREYRGPERLARLQTIYQMRNKYPREKRTNSPILIRRRRLKSIHDGRHPSLRATATSTAEQVM